MKNLSREELIELLECEDIYVHSFNKFDFEDGVLAVEIFIDENNERNIAIPLHAICQGCYVSSPPNEIRGFLSVKLSQEQEFLLFYEYNYKILKFAFLNSIRNGCEVYVTSDYKEIH